MVKSKEDKEILSRMNKLTKETAKRAKTVKKEEKKKLKDLRNRKKSSKKVKKAELSLKKTEMRTHINDIKADMEKNAKVVYGREKRGLKRLLVRNNINQKTFFSLIVNLFFSIFEFIGGFLSGSAAIMSDAIHDLGDAVSLGFSIYFGKKAHHGPDKKYTYGYSRFSVLGVFVTTVILIVGAAFMIYLSITRIINPTEVNVTLMFILSAIGLFLNSLATFRTENGRFNFVKAIETKSYNEILFEDVVGWVIVLLGTIVMAATEWYWLDPVMSILISIYLISTAFSSFKKVLTLFLEKVPDGESVDVVKYQVLAIPHVVDVHGIHLWSMDGETLCATMHVVVDDVVLDGVFLENSLEKPINIKNEIRKQLRSTGVKEVTIEVESKAESCKK
ncbi:cation transporter [Candidatus Saccharibacteria bacterium]|nr:cation transporter [Candidatus Saccharibacteria bacterium]